MELTEQVIASIVPGVPGTLGQSGSGARTANRVSASICISLAIVREGKIGDSITALIRNVSRTGVSFLVSSDMAVGQPFVVWFPTSDGHPVCVHCQVAWRDALSRASFIVSGAYTRMGTADEAVRKPAVELPSGAGFQPV